MIGDAPPHRVLEHHLKRYPFYSLTASLILAVILFSGGLANIVSRWSVQPEYSHGFFIPLVSLYILWEKRHALSFQRSSFNWLGLALCILSIGFLVVGEISALYIIIHYAFLCFLLGLALCFLGKAATVAFIPILILAFSIPLPYVIEVVFTAKMQLMSSTLGVVMIRWLDIPVFLSGNIIDMGEFKLHVVEACSGLRYLFPLSCIGFVVAYFYRTVLWKKVIIFLSTIPITIVLNSFRIAVSGVIVEYFGIESAQGFLHDFEGWIVFLLCMLVLLSEVIMLEKLTSKMSLAEAFKPNDWLAEHRYSSPAHHNKEAINLSHVALVVVLLAAIIAVKKIDERNEASLNNISFASFPMSLGQWHGERSQLDWDVIEELGLSDYLVANFYDNGEEGINLYVAFYNSQRKGVSPHSPKVCIPGGGWEIAEFKRTTLGDVPVNQAIIRKGSDAQLVYYWFVERGESVANEYYKKWMLLRDALTHNRTDGALVRLVVPLGSDNDIANAEQRAGSLLSLAYPRLLTYLPEAPKK